MRCTPTEPVVAPTRRPPWAAVVALGVLGAGGMALAAVLDHGSPWVTPDAATYLGVAHNLAHGDGLTSPFRSTLDPFSAVPSASVPLVHWPPGYPVVLAAFTVLGVTPGTAAELVNLLCAGSVIVLAGAIAWFRTGRPVPALALAGVVTGSAAVAQLGRFALSDLLFLTVCAGLLLAALRVLQGGPRAVWAVVALTTAAELVRWAGVALVVPSVVACLLAGRRRGAVAATAVPLAVAVAWQVVLLSVGGHGTRSVVWHPPVEVHALLRGIGTLFSPDTVSPGPALALGAAVLVASLAVGAVATGRGRDPFRVVLVVFLASYSAVLVASRLLVDADIPWDGRILAPVYLGVLVLVFDLAVDGGAAARWTGTAALAVLLLGQLWSWPSLVAAADAPQGLSARYWQHVPMEAVAARLRGYRVLASNHPDVVYLLLDRSALTVPDRVDPVTTRVDDAAGTDLRALARTLDHDGAVVLFVDPSNPRPYLEPGPTVVAACGLHLVAMFPGVSVWAR